MNEQRVRLVGHSYFRPSVEKNFSRQNEPEYADALRKRQIWCEGTFSAQKRGHNLRYLFRRGLEAADTPNASCLDRDEEMPDAESSHWDRYKYPALYRNKKGGRRSHKRVSRTDPEAGHMNRPGKPVGPHYLSHQTLTNPFSMH